MTDHNSPIYPYERPLPDPDYPVDISPSLDDNPRPEEEIAEDFRAADREEAIEFAALSLCREMVHIFDAEISVAEACHICRLRARIAIEAYEEALEIDLSNYG